MERTFEMEDSEISEKAIRSPVHVRKVIDQKPERDLNTPVIKINGSFTHRYQSEVSYIFLSRNGIICHVSCSQDNLVN